MSTVYDEICLNPDALDSTVYGRMAKTLIQAALPVAGRFEAASVAAEGWLNTAAAVAHFGKGRKRNVDAAYKLLMPTKGKDLGYNLLDSYCEHAGVLSRMASKLAALSGRDVIWKPLASGEYPITWLSAHEAAAGIARLMIGMLVCPIADITDQVKQWTMAERLLTARWKRFAMPPARVASLCAGIRRERAKMLEQPTLSVALTDEDRYILTVLDAHRGKALTYVQIEREATRLNRDDKRMRRLPDRTLRNRVPVLIERGFVAKPPRTKKKGVAITDTGHDALAFAAGNPPETRRKN